MDYKLKFEEARERYNAGNYSLETYLDQIAYLNIDFYTKVSDKLDIHISNNEESECTTNLTDVMWLTIRPSHNKTYEDLYRKVQRFITKYKNIKDYVLSYEQIGTNEETIGNGVHCHILFRHTYVKLSKLRVDIISNFKSLHDGYDFKKNKYLYSDVLCLKGNDKPQDIPNRIEYITGAKNNTETDPLKKEKQIYDKIWRKKMEIESYYGDISKIVRV